MNRQLIGDLLTVAAFVRVFGSDARALLRRAAAAGVRMGVSELHRGRRHRGGEQ